MSGVSRQSKERLNKGVCCVYRSVTAIELTTLAAAIPPPPTTTWGQCSAGGTDRKRSCHTRHTGRVVILDSIRRHKLPPSISRVRARRHHNSRLPLRTPRLLLPSPNEVVVIDDAADGAVVRRPSWEVSLIRWVAAEYCVDGTPTFPFGRLTSPCAPSTSVSSSSSLLGVHHQSGLPRRHSCLPSAHSRCVVPSWIFWASDAKPSLPFVHPASTRRRCRRCWPSDVYGWVAGVRSRL